MLIQKHGLHFHFLNVELFQIFLYLRFRWGRSLEGRALGLLRAFRFILGANIQIEVEVDHVVVGIQIDGLNATAGRWILRRVHLTQVSLNCIPELVRLQVVLLKYILDEHENLDFLVVHLLDRLYQGLFSLAIDLKVFLGFLEILPLPL